MFAEIAKLAAASLGSKYKCSWQELSEVVVCRMMSARRQSPRVPAHLDCPQPTAMTRRSLNFRCIPYDGALRNARHALPAAFAYVSVLAHGESAESS